MTDNRNSKTLVERFEYILSNYSSREHNYLHLKSVENFLFQLDKLNSDPTYQKIYSQLNDYFDLIQENFIDNRSDAILLFDKHILPIARTYKSCIPFHLIIKIRFIILFSVVFAIVFLILKGAFYYSLFIIIIDLLFYIRQLHFEKQKNCYGPFY